MSRPARPAPAGRGRVIALSVVVGVLIVVAAAVAATAYVSDRRGAEPATVAAPPATASAASSAATTGSSSAATSTPVAPAPSIPGTDALGFVGTMARCADGDTARMMVLTATSQAVVCERGGALYYAGWRMDTRAGTRIEGVLPAGPGWVARAPDATINITPAGLAISAPNGEFTEAATGFWASP